MSWPSVSPLLDVVTDECELSRAPVNRSPIAPLPGSSRQRRVLVVDDDERTAHVLIRMLKSESCVTTHLTDGESALESVFEHPPDLVLLDIMMPKLNGFDVCRRLKNDARTRFIPVVLVTGLGDRQARIQGIEAGADDFIAKVFDPWELRARVRSLLRAKSHVDELDSAEAVIISLALTIEARDPSTDQHCQRLAIYASRLGQHLSLDTDAIETLRKGGYLHDLGKIGIPDAILLKPERLTPEEYCTMKQHPVIGDRLCGELRSLASVRPIVRHHHERLNGQGYPDRLRGANIPILAQIMGVVDTFDALTTARPYRLALPIDEAFEQLHIEVNKEWLDATLVNEFIALVQAGSFEKTPPRPSARRSIL